jgi:2,4-dienoyl-CoA reductase-like NADH-dependent reductase (Old Yellow Enzyme family)/8-oxo-dGTP pyrophosphatase MutT (NUDIX family)
MTDINSSNDKSIQRELAKNPVRNAAVCGLLDENDNILMVRTKRLPNHWQPIGGGMEPEDNRPIDTVIREVKEEAGLELNESDFVFVVETNYDFGEGKIFFYKARVDSSFSFKFKLDELEGWGWVSIPSALELDMFPATRKFLVELAIQHAPAELSSLLQPITIGGVNVKNRLGLGPINDGLFAEDGSLEQSGLEFFEQYFRDGLGLVYVGGVAVSQEGMSNASSLLLDSETKTQGLKQLSQLAAEYRSMVVVQLMHAGRQTNPNEIHAQIVAPSAIPCPVVGHLPKELTTKEIKVIREKFVNSARFVEASGAHIVEVHASHGYLISEFLSPYANKRNDEYGGNLENRFRFLREILSDIRSAVDIPVGVRINCYENVKNGLTVEDVVDGVKRFIGEYIDYISVSAGVYSHSDIIMPPRDSGKALLRTEAKRLKDEFDLPVFICGNIDTAQIGASLIDDGVADFILMVRALLSETKFLMKSVTKQLEKIQECTDCKMCKYHTRGKEEVYCPFNEVLVSRDKHQKEYGH